MNGKLQNPPDPNLIPQLCMTFSAIVKAMQGHLTADNVLPVLDKVWHWTKVTLGEAMLEIPKEPTTTSSELPPPSSESPPKKGDGKISDAQQKRLFAIARNAKMSTEQLKAFLKDNYGIESTKDIPWQQYQEICEAVENFGVPF